MRRERGHIVRHAFARSAAKPWPPVSAWKGNSIRRPGPEKALALAGPGDQGHDRPRRVAVNRNGISARRVYDALQVFHTAGDAEQAMKYGMLAVEHLEAGSVDRQLEPVEAYMLGRLYFRIGSVCALHMKDPQQAVSWFERAIPLLDRPVPAAALVERGRHGESFVSMAVSYWAVGSHEEAVPLDAQQA